MENNNELLNKNNGINTFFANQPKQEDAYVYTLMIYDHSSKEEKTFEKINSYINSVCIGTAGGVIGNSTAYTFMFASHVAIPVISSTIKLFNVDYFLYEINKNHYIGSSNCAFVRGAVEAVEFVNKK
jgi:hypothetical protein